MSHSMIMSRLITQPLISNVPCNGRKLNIRQIQKENVILVMGATATGKSKLSIDLANYFPSEIINSDKIQIYQGLDIVTNKITIEEQKAIPHHLLGIHNPNIEFTSNDFREKSTSAIDSITGRGHLPIIVGGSNSYLEALIDDDDYNFRSRYNFCCLWVDVSESQVQRAYIEQRVDQMFNNGMINELRPFYNPTGDYSKGIRKAIGVPEFHEYFRMESFVDEKTRKNLLEKAVSDIKINTWKLARKQLRKIDYLKDVKRWEIHRLDATPVFRKRGKEANETWKKIVAEPSAMIVANFLYNSANVVNSSSSRNLRVPLSQNDLMAATC